MSEIKIEKGVPMPTRAPYKTKYPVRGMEVGDSFFVQKNGTGLTDVAVRNAVRQAGNRHGYKMATRSQDGAWRCWRIA